MLGNKKIVFRSQIGLGISSKMFCCLFCTPIHKGEVYRLEELILFFEFRFSAFEASYFENQWYFSVTQCLTVKQLQTLHVMLNKFS